MGSPHKKEEDIAPIISQAHEEIEATPHGQRAAVRAKWAAAAGIRENSLDRLILRKCGRRRAQRSDAGSCHIEGIDAYVRQVDWLQRTLQRKFKKSISTRAALSIGEIIGIAPAVNISYEVVKHRRRMMRNAKRATTENN